MIVLPLCLPTLISSFSNKPHVLQLRVCFMGNLTYEGKWWLLTGTCMMADETLDIVFFFFNSTRRFIEYSASYSMKKKQSFKNTRDPYIPKVKKEIKIPVELSCAWDEE